LIPDPVFKAKYQSGSGSRVLMIQNLKQFTAEYKFDIFRSKMAIYLSVGLHEGRPSYRRSPQTRTSSASKHEIYYCFLFYGSFFALLDPDPDSESG
jgi:hypothetical protein